ncbi:MAG: efflux RND transporter permease subunit, partial [Gammaproteobacteria bacterium]|nr:efflux RND transporter permease subunit [Gammaproteobacteria bacterium]
MSLPASAPLDAFSRMLGRLVDGPLPLLLTVLALLAGVASLLVTPREEEPQIVVPAADVMIRAPGLSALEVERQVSTPLAKLLRQIDGVEHVYSASRAGEAVVTVRFHVGEDREDALLKVYAKVYSNTDRIPPAVGDWVVRPLEIDDVPVLVAAMWSSDEAAVDDHALRRIAEEMEQRLQALPDTNRVYVTGGRSRRIRVELDAQELAARGTAPLDVAQALKLSNRRASVGMLLGADRIEVLDAGPVYADVGELRTAVVNVVDGIPVYLGDVARIVDGPAEPQAYTWLMHGAASDAPLPGQASPAVFLAVAKRKGANAVWVAAAAREELQRLAAALFPPQVHLHYIRDYGRTANDKVSDLVLSLVAAIVTVVLFIGVFMGWRAALVVALAVPVCYGLTLGLDYLAGYTINRVTLFALILALGLVVDDPITGVDNIDRWQRNGEGRPLHLVLAAMAEVRMPLIMSTVAIVIVFAPLSFITGMMGPYMAPMA